PRCRARGGAARQGGGARHSFRASSRRSCASLLQSGVFLDTSTILVQCHSVYGALPEGLASAIALAYGTRCGVRTLSDRILPDDAVRSDLDLPMSPRSPRCAAVRGPLRARSRSRRRRGLPMTPRLPTPLRTRAFIDGGFAPSASGATFESTNPATGEVLAEISSCDAQDVDRAVTAARASFESRSEEHTSELQSRF